MFPAVAGKARHGGEVGQGYNLARTQGRSSVGRAAVLTLASPAPLRGAMMTCKRWFRTQRLRPCRAKPATAAECVGATIGSTQGRSSVGRAAVLTCARETPAQSRSPIWPSNASTANKTKAIPSPTSCAPERGQCGLNIHQQAATRMTRQAPSNTAVTTVSPSAPFWRLSREEGAQASTLQTVTVRGACFSGG